MPIFNRLRFLAALCIATSIAGLPAAAVAQSDGKGPALTEPPEDDPNFPLLGEFTGPLEVGENKYEAIGLQVRPSGGDSFQAISFRGGLPGEESHQPGGTELIGRRSGDMIILSGQRFAIFVEQDHCELIDGDGNRLGRLQRVRRQSPTLGAEPPENAMVIFDGSGTEHFSRGEMTKEGLLMQGADFKPMFKDFNLHVEFRVPYMPKATGQSSGNSGLYLQSRYECQILDSFARERLVNGLGALYRFRKPDLNMAFPPLAWQTYDVQFTAPRWNADGSKRRNARITAWVNGVKVHDDVEVPNKTGAGKQEGPAPLPVRLQDHGDPVRFRNVWIVDRGLDTRRQFPVMAQTGTEKDSGDGEKEKTEKKPADEAETGGEETGDEKQQSGGGEKTED